MENLEVSPEFWSGKKVFLTGHTGFKGSWLALWLKSLGAEVTGYSLPPASEPSHFQGLELGSSITSHLGDIRDLPKLTVAIQAADPEIVLHLAAQPLVRQSYEDPIETYDINVVGTAKVLQAIRGCKSIKSVVVITTDKVYENREWNWGYRENDMLGGYDPYSNSKACTELVTSSFTRSFFNPADYSSHGVAIATARAGNVFGGGDWAQDRLIPDLIRAYRDKKSPVIRYPGSIRPWQHVLEPLRGYLMLAKALYAHGTKFNGAYNFGPNESDARSVKTICEIVSGNLNGSEKWVLDEAKNPHEAGFLKLDISKASADLGWRPKTDLEYGLLLATRWYSGALAGESILDLSMRDLADYQSM